MLVIGWLDERSHTGVGRLEYDKETAMVMWSAGGWLKGEGK